MSRALRNETQAERKKTASSELKELLVCNLHLISTWPCLVPLIDVTMSRQNEREVKVKVLEDKCNSASWNDKSYAASYILIYTKQDAS